MKNWNNFYGLQIKDVHLNLILFNNKTDNLKIKIQGY